jgi:putative tryptophan/tyrosine transport system substrate-binding protein
MRRRELMVLLGGAITVPRLLHAQQKSMPVIGFLSSVSSGPSAPYMAAFHQGLRETGYVEGQNVAIEYRWAEGQYDRLPALAADLVGRKVDVIATAGGTSSAFTAKRATSTIPIVFCGLGDPVGEGLIASLARPGANITGMSLFTRELNAKRLELLFELVPRAEAFALLVNPTSSNAERVIADVQEAGRSKGVKLHVLKAAAEGEFEIAFASLVQLSTGALLVGSDPFFNSRRDELVALAARYAIPAMYEWREYVTAGGLVSYGASLTVAYRQAATYIGRILTGAKPNDLPVQQPTTFELVVNLKTAKALGLTIPQLILARADEVIE